MMKFKYFFNCCCKYLDEKEEEKIQSGTKIESFNKSLGESHNFIINLGDESSIIAAPFPNHDGNSIDYPRLRIRIIESSAVPVGTILTINPTGMEGSKRNKADYKTFIGSKLSENDEILNDFVIEESSKGMGKQHLVIKFNPPKQKYSITDLGDGSGTFVRIDSPLVLKDGFIISFGNSHMTIHYDSSQK
jgi:FHA domain